MEYFENYFDAEVITFFVTETNRLAKQFQTEKKYQISPPSQIHRNWYDTNDDKMKVFLGLLILEGIDSKVENAMYFT